jgi:hypothetical protein
MRRLPITALFATLATIVCGTAQAHTPFFKPLSFHPDTNIVYAESAYSTRIFLPEVGISSADFQMLRPNGSKDYFREIDVEPYNTVLEASLSERGTYRFSTGEVYGDVSRMILDRHHWRAVRAGERVSRRARTSTMRIVALAETYVTRGAPTRAPLDVTIGRLAIHPISHPNRVSVASGFDVELLFDGAPFARMPFVLYDPVQSEDDVRRTFVTDEHGRAHIAFDHPGTYLTVVRFRTPAPANAGAAVLSYSTSLTFEVTTDTSLRDLRQH